MTFLRNLLVSTGSTSTVLSVLPLSDKNSELLIAFVSSVIVQVTIKLAEHFQKKRRINRIKKSYGSDNHN